MVRGHHLNSDAKGGDLVAVMDWTPREVVSWKLSNRLEGRFCVGAFGDALKRAERVPRVFNTDQGSQFTSKV